MPYAVGGISFSREVGPPSNLTHSVILCLSFSNVTSFFEKDTKRQEWGECVHQNKKCLVSLAKEPKSDLD